MTAVVPFGAANPELVGPLALLALTLKEADHGRFFR